MQRKIQNREPADKPWHPEPVWRRILGPVTDSYGSQYRSNDNDNECIEQKQGADDEPPSLLEHERVNAIMALDLAEIYRPGSRIQIIHHLGESISTGCAHGDSDCIRQSHPTEFQCGQCGLGCTLSLVDIEREAEDEPPLKEKLPRLNMLLEQWLIRNRMPFGTIIPPRDSQGRPRRWVVNTGVSSRLLFADNPVLPKEPPRPQKPPRPQAQELKEPPRQQEEPPRRQERQSKSQDRQKAQEQEKSQDEKLEEQNERVMIPESKRPQDSGPADLKPVAKSKPSNRSADSKMSATEWMSGQRRGICGHWDPIEFYSGIHDPMIIELILRYLLTITSEDIGVPLFTFRINEKQHLAMQIIRKSSDCIVLLGFGGTGKSTILRYLVPELRQSGVDCGVTAYTGIASVSLGLGGSTVHSFFGFLVSGSENLDELIGKWESGRHIPGAPGYRLANASKIVVDEFTMVPNRHWSLLDKGLRIFRGCPSKPFGGIQFILSGDFAQLRPIDQRPEAKNQQQVHQEQNEMERGSRQGSLLDMGFEDGAAAARKEQEEDEKKPLYQTKLWKRCFKHVILFDHVYRQSDPATVALARRARKGYQAMTVDDHMFLRSLVTPPATFEVRTLREQRECKQRGQVYFPPLYVHGWKKCVEPWNLQRLQRLRTPPTDFYGEIHYNRRIKKDQLASTEIFGGPQGAWKLDAFQYVPQRISSVGRF